MDLREFLITETNPGIPHTPRTRRMCYSQVTCPLDPFLRHRAALHHAAEHNPNQLNQLEIIGDLGLIYEFK